MAEAATGLAAMFPALKGGRAVAMLGVPMLVVMILAMMVLPLPAWLLDLLFTFNIAVSLIVILVAVNTKQPLDFSVFPTVLLLTTLLRLSLNVASTRIVLMEGHQGTDAAGKVIEAFGHFLIGGNYTVGLVVFAILTIINFVVITKGAGRIAEVAARFTLDAMPGKQMAIDADLNAGLIGEDEARSRRENVSREADFFGSMDGASKFVRGDAVAGILILFINLIGGIIIGVVQHDLSAGDASAVYIALSIGDGLVAQVPALIVSVAAGVVVSRVSDSRDLGTTIVDQMLNKPEALYMAAGILGVMGLIPGMPNLAFLALAGALAGAARMRSKQAAVAAVTPERDKAAKEAEEKANVAPEVSWKDVSLVDDMGLEVGYRLIPLVDQQQDGELLRRVKGVRKKFTQEMGFLPAAVHIRDNLEIKPAEYRLYIRGVEMGRGELQPNMFMCINPGGVNGKLDGIQGADPTFGLPATWVDAAQRDRALAMGYTVVDASTVVATHLAQVMQQNAATLFGRTELQELLQHVGGDNPKQVEDVVPKIVPLAVLHRVAQNLLAEGVDLRDMRTLLEVMAERGAKTQEIEELTTHARAALGRAIVHKLFPGTQEVRVLALEPGLERTLTQVVTSGGEGAGIEPGLAETLLRETQTAADKQEQMGFPPVLLSPAPLRNFLSRFLRRAVPGLSVLSHAEIPDDRNIRLDGVVGAQGGR